MNSPKRSKEPHLASARTTISMPRCFLDSLIKRASETGFSDFSAYLQTLGREDLNKGLVGPARPQLLTFAS